MNPAPAQGSSSASAPSRDLLLRAAEALELYSREIEGIGEVVCSHAEIIETNLDKLQSIDRISQCLGQLAIVMRSDDPDGAVDAVSIGFLQEQLRPATSEKVQDDAFARLS